MAKEPATVDIASIDPPNYFKAIPGKKYPVGPEFRKFDDNGKWVDSRDGQPLSKIGFPRGGGPKFLPHTLVKPDGSRDKAAEAAYRLSDEYKAQVARRVAAIAATKEANRIADLSRPPPEKLSPEDSEKWVTFRMSQLTPHALWVLQGKLFGNDEKAKERAALEFLDRGGFAKKTDQNRIGAAPVMILVGDAVKALPWSQKKAIQEGTATEADFKEEK